MLLSMGSRNAVATGVLHHARHAGSPIEIGRYRSPGNLLLYECLELMAHKRITLPRPEKDLLIEIRSGEWPLERVLVHAKKLTAEVEEGVSTSSLPETVDRDAISQLVAQIHLDFWK